MLLLTIEAMFRVVVFFFWVEGCSYLESCTLVTSVGFSFNNMLLSTQQLKHMFCGVRSFRLLILCVFHIDVTSENHCLKFDTFE